MLSGYKTYIVAFMVALIAVVEGPMGVDLPGVDIGPDWFDYLMTSAFGATFRSAIKSMLGN